MLEQAKVRRSRSILKLAEKNDPKRTHVVKFSANIRTFYPILTISQVPYKKYYYLQNCFSISSYNELFLLVKQTSNFQTGKFFKDLQVPCQGGEDKVSR